MSGMLTVLIQSGLDITSMGNLNILNPSASLNRNRSFVLMTGIGYTIFAPLSSSILVSAYLKYSDKKFRPKL